MVDVDRRALHPPAALLAQLRGSVCALTLLCAILVWTRGCCLCRVWFMGFNQTFPQLSATSARSQLNYSLLLVMDGLWIEAVLF